MILFSIIAIRYGYSDNSRGEMTYSVLDFLLNEKFVIVIKAFCSLIFVFLVLDIFIEQKKRADPFLRLLIIITITYLFACSLGRPVQRYLIFCLPFIYYFLVFYRLNCRKLAHIIILVVTFILFSTTNIALVLYQVSQASAAEDMVKWVSDANLMGKTLPSAINVHSGHHFMPFVAGGADEYYISGTKSSDQISLHEESVYLFGYRIKTYYCIKY